ncbi:MAG: M67 family metallopeptidase [Thaumarchaeota archaeon]|nr:M67 family metallopeptidase [Nitrososphaerota archaeon]
MNADPAHSSTEFNPIQLKLILAESILNEMESHASSTFPEECCGLLLGVFENNSRTKNVKESMRMSNVFQKEERYHRYTIDPKEFMKAENEAEARGLDVVGIYHSHPNAPAKPSLFDMSYAWPSLSYVVIEVRDASPVDVKSWELKADRSEFVQEEMIKVA